MRSKRASSASLRGVVCGRLTSLAWPSTGTHSSIAPPCDCESSWSQVHHELRAVVPRQLVPGPRVVHADRLEVAHLDADVAAHAAPVVDPELVDDLAALALAGGVLRVVLHHDGHALDRAGALAGVAAGAERLVVLLVPDQDREGAVALGEHLVQRRVVARRRASERRP